MAGCERLLRRPALCVLVLLASANATANLIIYDDALAPGWSDYSYPSPGIVVDFANPAPVHSGADSIAVTFNGPFAALSLRTATPLVGSAYSAIRFWIYGSGAGGTSLAAFTQATDSGPGSPTYTFTAPPGGWTQYVVPLSVFGNPVAIARFSLQDTTNTNQPTFYVDAIDVVAAGGSGVPSPIATRVLGQTGFASNGGGTTASTLSGPAAIAVGPDGALYVADYNNSRVLSWASAHNFGDGEAATLVLGQPDFTNGNAGSGGNQLTQPEGVTVDRQGNVFVADTGNHRIMVFSPPLSNGMNATLSFGSRDPDPNCGGVALDIFCFPRALASDAQDNIYLIDEFHNRALIYISPLTTDTTPDQVIGNLFAPRGITVDASANVYVSDSENDVVREYDTPLVGDTMPDRVYGSGSDGVDCFTAAVPAPTQTSLACPIDLAIDPAGNLYVSDLYHNRVLAYLNPLTDNVPDAVFGQQGSFTTGDPNHGGLSAESMSSPLGLAFDDSGSLYLADFDNNRVLAYDAVTDRIFADGFE